MLPLLELMGHQVRGNEEMELPRVGIFTLFIRSQENYEIFPRQMH